MWWSVKRVRREASFRHGSNYVTDSACSPHQPTHHLPRDCVHAVHNSSCASFSVFAITFTCWSGNWRHIYSKHFVLHWQEAKGMQLWGRKKEKPACVLCKGPGYICPPAGPGQNQLWALLTPAFAHTFCILHLLVSILSFICGLVKCPMEAHYEAIRKKIWTQDEETWSSLSVNQDKYANIHAKAQANEITGSVG